MHCPGCGEKLPIGLRGVGDPINVCPGCAGGFRIHAPIRVHIANLFTLISTIFIASILSESWGGVAWLLAFLVVLGFNQIIIRTMVVPKLVIPKSPSLLKSYSTPISGDVSPTPDLSRASQRDAR